MSSQDLYFADEYLRSWLQVDESWDARIAKAVGKETMDRLDLRLSEYDEEEHGSWRDYSSHLLYPGEEEKLTALVRDGTLQYQRDDGSYSVAAPGDLLFSTVTMSATHLWDGEWWKPIYNED